MQTHSFPSQETVLQTFEAGRARAESRAVIQTNLAEHFRKYRAATTPVQKKNAFYLALNGVHNTVQERLAFRGTKENQNVTFMQMGAAIGEIFLAKNIRQFERRFENFWRQDWW